MCGGALTQVMAKAGYLDTEEILLRDIELRLFAL